jgi:rubrerythrin
MEATMFSEKDLQALLDYSEEGQVLSLYLHTDPSKVNPEAAKIELRNLLKSVDLPEDAQVIEDYINLEYDWSAKGLAVFSNQAAGVFQVYPLGLSVLNEIYIGKHPTVRPLVQLLDTFTGWSVVLVDKQGARLFSFNLGELGEMEGIAGNDVKQTKRGGGNAMPGRMGGSGASAKVENIIDRNIREVIDFATEFFQQHHIRRIMIGGTEENISRFLEELPKAWQSLVVGGFPMSMVASHPEVLDQATKEALAAQEKLNNSLVEQAITLAAKGSSGVTGLIDTLNAIHEGRVRTLLVSQDYEQEGYRCARCGYLTTQELDKCPFCGGSFELTANAVEMAVQEALQKNTDVKVVQGNDSLEKAGHITAILRY